MDTDKTTKWIISEGFDSPFTPNYVITFNKDDNKEMGKLDFNGDKLKFEGDVEESGKFFVDFVLEVFNQKIEEIKKEAFDAGVKAEYLSYKNSFIDKQTN